MSLIEHIQKGETKLIFSPLDFDERSKWVEDELAQHADVVIFKEIKMKIDTVRDFAYEMQKGSVEGVYGVEKLGILVCDDIALPAQNSLLKILEDINPNYCICILSHSEAVYLPTIFSRVIEVKLDEDKNSKDEKIKIKGKTVAERLESVKKIMKEFDDEKITKQEILEVLEQVKENKDVYARAFSMLKQPSVSVKYVLEYVASAI